MSNLTLAVAPMLLSLSTVSHGVQYSNNWQWQIIRTSSTCSLECLVNLSFFILTLNQFDSTAPSCNFTLNLKLISANSHFLLSLFRTFTSILWLFWFGFWTSISYWLSLYQPLSFCFTCITAYYLTHRLGIILQQITYTVGFCKHFKFPHLFHLFLSK